MSVFIPGMDMPDCCDNCPCYDYLDEICRAENLNGFCVENSSVCSEHCSLVEIRTPHGRLIDADKLIELFNILSHLPENSQWLTLSTIIRQIKEAPTIIEAEAEK